MGAHRLWSHIINVGIRIGILLCLSPALAPLKAQELNWVKSAGGTGASVATDGAGNSYVTGNFTGTARFGAGETNETTLTSAGTSDIFVAKYGASGSLIWALRAGGTNLVH